MKPNFAQGSSICQGQDSAQVYVTAAAEFVLCHLDSPEHGAGDSKGSSILERPCGGVGSLEHGAQGLLS